MPTVITWLPWLMVALVVLGVSYWALSRSVEPTRLAWKGVATLVVAVGIWLYASKTIGFGARGSYLGNFASAALLAGGIAVGGILLGLIWARSLGELLSRPLSGLFDDAANEIKPAPLYSSAIARRKQGLPKEAIAEIGGQLKRFPGDFQGTLMQAEIEALDLHDLPAAEATLSAWRTTYAHDPGEQAIALTKLADWHLRITHDTEAARRCLQAIVRELPNTDASLLAEQRLAHLDFEVQPRNCSLQLEIGSGAPIDVGVPPPPPAKPTQTEAAEIVDHLQQFPHDLVARERLAIVYAWDYSRPDLARTELETLIRFRRASPREIARWLNLLVDIEIQVARDLDAARATLQRLIDRDPEAAAAAQATSRMHLLPREMARHQEVRVLRRSSAKPG